MSVTCSFEVTCWERADPLAFLHGMFSCVLSLSHTLSAVSLLLDCIDSWPLPSFLLWVLSNELFTLLHDFVCKTYASHTSLCKVSDEIPVSKGQERRCRF